MAELQTNTPGTIEAHALARHVRMSPQKARLVIDLIRGQKAQDALQDGLHETTRALKVMKRRAETFEDAAEHYVKREPLKAVALTAGVALLVGLAIGWKTRRRPRRIFGAVV